MPTFKERCTTAMRVASVRDLVTINVRRAVIAEIHSAAVLCGLTDESFMEEVLECFMADRRSKKVAKGKWIKERKWNASSGIVRLGLCDTASSFSPFVPVGSTEKPTLTGRSG